MDNHPRASPIRARRADTHALRGQFTGSKKHQRTRSLRTTSTTLVVALLGATAIAATSLAERRHRLVYNPSGSAPRGWYSVHPATSLPPVGSLVLVWLPGAARRLADERRYLPESVPALKRVVAGPGDQVCELNGRVTVDRHPLASATSYDAAGRQLFPWSGCQRLGAEQVFLLNTENGASFDSRYFGPVDRAQLIGAATPLWTWR